MAPPQEQAQFFPISEISTYQSRWTIRARVTGKSQLRTFSKAASTGKVFSVELLDEHGGDIRASFFNEAVDQYGDLLQVGKCFTFSKGNVRVANRQFNTSKHRYELVFDKMAEVKEVADTVEIQAMKLSVTSIRSLQERTLPCTVDLCGIITFSGPVRDFTSQAGKRLVKREVTIVDDSATSINVTLWGERAQQDDKLFDGNPVAGIKGVIVKNWQESLDGSLLQNGLLMLRPTNLPEAEKVQTWWSQGGSTQEITALSKQGGDGNRRALVGKPVDIAGMRQAAESLSTSTDVENFSIVCRLAFVSTKKQGEKHPLVYTACQEPKQGNGLPCNRRVDSSGFCSSCNLAGRAAPRFNLRCKFQDFSDSAFITTFHEAAQKVLQMTSEDGQRLDDGDEAVREAAVQNQYFAQPLQLTVRAKKDMYMNELRSNITCVDARPVSHKDWGRAMLKEIGDMLAASA